MTYRPSSIAGILLAAALSAAGPLARAQAPPAGTIEGVVVDSAGVPLAFAVARIIDLHLSQDTHEDGRFTLREVPAGRRTVTIQRIGYRPRSITVLVDPGQVATVRVALVPAVFELAPIVVTGTVGERRGDEVLSPTSVVTGANLDRKLDATVAAILQNQPGVSVSSLGPATARPVIRGLSGDRILVLEDGVRAGDMSSTSADHAVAIEPLTARQIEVVRGPMSLLYGSSALGGVVNVIREEIPTARSDRLHGTLSAQGNSGNRGGSVAGFVRSGMAGLAVRGEGTAHLAGETRTPLGRLVNTQAQTFGAALGVARIGDRGHAGGSYRFYQNHYGIPGGFVGGHAQGVDVEMRRHTVRAEAERHPGGDLSTLRAASQFTWYEHTELEPTGSVGTRFQQSLTALELLARREGTGSVAQGAAGLRGQFRDIRTGGTLRTPSTWDASGAGFLVQEFLAGPARLQLGARYDWARYAPRDTTAFVSAGGQRIPVRPRTYGSFSGSGGVLLGLVPGWRIGASVSRAYRTPDFNELYSNGPHLAANSYDVGDPRLTQETGLGLDVFLRVTHERIQAELAAFRNQLDHYVFPSSRGRAELGAQGGVPRFQYTNEDAVFEGVEADVKGSLGSGLELDGTLSYVRARFTSARAAIPVITATDTTFVPASQYPPFIPPLNGRVGLHFERGVLFAAGEVRLAASQERVGDFEDPTTGYAVGSVSAGVRLLAGERFHTITLRADNITNEEYRDHLSRLKAVMPEPGRSFSLLYRMTF